MSSRSSLRDPENGLETTLNQPAIGSIPFRFDTTIRSGEAASDTTHWYSVSFGRAATTDPFAWKQFRRERMLRDKASMSHTFSRKELLDLVWSKPTRTIAKRSGIPDVGFML